MINGVLQSGFQGIQNGMNSAQKAAGEIATAPASETGFGVAELAQSAVDLKVAEHQVKASAAVIRSADEALGTLLDTTA